MKVHLLLQDSKSAGDSVAAAASSSKAYPLDTLRVEGSNKQGVAELNEAAQHFISVDTNGQKEDLRKFSAWYDDNVIKYLMHSQPNKRPMIRYQMLSFANASFSKQLQALIDLKELLRMSTFFISFEPGEFDTHHFIFGVLSEENDLLIINH